MRSTRRIHGASRVVFLRASGAAALDTLIAFPATADSLALDFALQLAADAPAGGGIGRELECEVERERIGSRGKCDQRVECRRARCAQEDDAHARELRRVERTGDLLVRRRKYRRECDSARETRGIIGPGRLAPAV